MDKAFFPDQAPIDAYGNGGFRFAEMSHQGSLLCLPSGMHAWEPGRVTVASELTLNLLGRVVEDAEAIEVLLIGTGPSQIFITSDLREELADYGLVVETMATGAAARTYNVLLAEQRAVAAALIAVD